ncbi:uncharacterized protein [Euphorbia lathyris]|uniref:uncharacterized protein isoform X1 n=1 Tax=Euphorbia lathyris TaxID=212925 RepID=UPI003314345D
MGKDINDKCIFPLTSLQIGDMQSYLSDLSLFLALESNKLYILVDNRPWLRDLGSRPAHLWQLMVTKSRLSPFANTKAQKGKKEEKDRSPDSSSSKSKKFERWFSLIEVANLSPQRGLLPVKKLQNSLVLSSKLHRTLYGFIVFEVVWKNVQGINYLNELQTDTSLAIETKIMRRWEFDSIEQAASCISWWFSGTYSDELHLKDHLDSAIGDVFYDAEDNFSMTLCINDDENICNNSPGDEDNSPCCSSDNSSIYPGTPENRISYIETPRRTGSYKRRRITRSNSSGGETDCYSEETLGGIEDLLETYTNDCENTIEAKKYRDVLILFRFSDHDLPFKLRQIIMSDLRLLTLLEAGLPSWAIFLQSYPVVCHLYRPWMCPLARALYVVISVVTVLIGFYDLYKNVPVLKATASRLCGPLFDWIETWEMASRIQYLGTMLFLHNFQKGLTWFLTVTRTTRSFFSVFTQPLAGPLSLLINFLFPMWNVVIEVIESLCSIVGVVTGSFCSIVIDMLEVILWPLWLIISVIWGIATSVFCPMFWILVEILWAPIRLVFAISSGLAFVFASIIDFVGHILRVLSSICQLSSPSVVATEASVWHLLWKDLFSKVFRALKSIFYGFIAFFTTCNRHRLSIYNHIQGFIRRRFGQAQRSVTSDTRSIHGTESLAAVSRKIHIS